MARSSPWRDVRRTTGDDRMVAGVAGGIARRLGVDPVLVRLAFVVLAVTSGIGVLLYIAGVVVLPPEDAADPLRRGDGADRGVQQSIGLGLLTAGLLLASRRLGTALPDGVILPVAVIVVGAAIAWTRLDGRSGDLFDAGRSVVVRIVIGAVLVAVGIGTFAALNERLVVATQIVIAVAVTTGGVVLLAGPWIFRLARHLGEERAERIRSDERAAVAAHLHDSVLQTLALIQRRADSPSETVALARRQERELREWLYGSGDAPTAATTLAAALRSIATEVEADHPITVDVVVVGDAPLGEAAAAIAAATREGVVNAAKHSGASTVSVYGEIDGPFATVFVRDRGRGFEPATVPDDRRGLADSVQGRLARVGGAVEIQAEPGDGTELVLTVPLEDHS